MSSADRTDPARPKAVAVIVSHHDRVLLVRRSAARPLPGYWTPVTGRVEPGERLEAAAAREVHEEVGLSIHLGSACHQGTTSDGRFDMTYFTATLDGATALTLQTDEIDDARWLTAAELDALEPMLATTRAVLAKVCRR